MQNGNSPYYFVVGAGKAATSWLHACLEEHPEAYVPPEKEIHYFSFYFDKPLSWYISFFKGVTEEKVIMDISPSYLVDKQAPERIWKFNSNAHLIFIFRDPVQRAYSHYKMWLRGGKVSENIDQELHTESSLVQEGLYFYHLQKFLEYFPENQIHCFLYDDLEQDPASFLQNFFYTLNINSEFQPSLLHNKYHETKSRPKNQWIYDTGVNTINFLTKTLRFKALISGIEFLRRKGYVNFFHQLNKGKPFPELSEVKRAELCTFFKNDIEQLSNFLGRDLSNWLD